jgi:hypothetical protein
MVAALMLLGACLAPADALASGPELVAAPSAAELSLGVAVAITGQIGEEGRGLGGIPLVLQASGYPYRGFLTLARLTSSPDGSFTFAGVKLDRNTRLRVESEGSPAASSASIHVTVDPSAAINASSLGAGQVRLSLRLGHTTTGGSAPVNVRWFVAASGTRVFHLAAVTPARELAPGLTYASATIDPPAKRFVYRACVNPSWELAMGAPSSHGACPQHDYTVPHDVG